MSADLVSGFILGTMMRMRPPPHPLGLIVGFSIIAAVIIVGILFCRKVGDEKISDTAKALWSFSFFLLPVLSWVAYHFVVQKGTSISKTNK